MSRLDREEEEERRQEEGRLQEERERDEDAAHGGGGRMGVACHPGPRDPISWVALLGRAESLARYRQLKI